MEGREKCAQEPARGESTANLRRFVVRLQVSHASQEAWVREVDGLKLWFSRVPSSSGYRCVQHRGEKFAVFDRQGCQPTLLGYFDSRVDAAVAYAKFRLQATTAAPFFTLYWTDECGCGLWCEQDFEIPHSSMREAAIDCAASIQNAMRKQGDSSFVTSVNGMQLHLSASSVTGYQGVYRVCTNPMRYEAQLRQGRTVTKLGRFHDPLAAAIRYAWYCRELH